MTYETISDDLSQTNETKKHKKVKEKSEHADTLSNREKSRMINAKFANFTTSV